jgi:RNA polymerase sigma-70 factor (ECF subfamily)
MIGLSISFSGQSTGYDRQLSLQASMTSEARLLHQAQQGNLDAFNQLVISYQDRVYRQALWVLGEPEEAADAAQEAFLRAYQNLHTFHGTTFRAWLLRITTNYCLDLLRRRKSHPVTPLMPLDEDCEENESPSWMVDLNQSTEVIFEHKELRSSIRKCLYRLTPDYRAAITLVDIQGLDYQEAAGILGVCLGTFKSRLLRARQQFQKLFKDDGQVMPGYNWMPVAE